MPITDEVKIFAKRIGLDVVRVTSAEPFADAAKRIKEQIQRGLRPKWNIETIDAYCDPRSALSSAKSIIVAAECYLTSEPVDRARGRYLHYGERSDKPRTYVERIYSWYRSVFSTIGQASVSTSFT